MVKGASGTMATTSKKTGFWHEKKQELKISKIKNWALCPRCKKLKGSSQYDENLAPDSKMTEVFRREVSKIRQKEKAVVILCVDATNVSGTLIQTIRNYVGGNPILVAVTRCDLLPQYMLDDPVDLKQRFVERMREISPAEVYMCSVERDYILETGGVKELSNDLWKYLDGRDPYVVGAANIGKSTLTDLLISVFVKKGEKARHFTDRLSRKRVIALQESRVTKSALPGTTLQNIRVPCFQDHLQALWDTPGLLLDESTKHFPIRNFREVRAQRPTQIEPQIMEVTEKSFALIISEKGDDLPLLRMEIRLKRNAEGEGPVRLVWNSILDLDVAIVDIEQARKAEDERAKRIEESAEEKSSSRGDDENEALSSEVKKRSKAERKRAYEEKIKQEQQELGMKEWERRQEEKKLQAAEYQRTKALSRLRNVTETICEGDYGTDIVVANFGWLGILPPRPAMVKTFAPSTGVRVTSHATLALPSSWGEYKRQPETKGKENEDDRDDEYDEYDDEYGDEFDEDEYDEYDDDFGDYDDDYLDYVDPGDHNFDWRDRGRTYDNSESKDPWEKYSGENIGWRFDLDTRWSKAGLKEGWNPIRKEDPDKNLA